MNMKMKELLYHLSFNLCGCWDDGFGVGWYKRRMKE